MSLGWNAASDNVAVASYQVTRDGSTVATLPATARAWSDHSVTAGSTYDYAVAAVDTSGNVGAAATKTVDVPAGRADPDTDPDAHAGPDAPTPRADAHARADPDARPDADSAARRRRTDRARAAHRHADDDDRQPRVGRGIR